MIAVRQVFFLFRDLGLVVWIVMVAMMFQPSWIARGDIKIDLDVYGANEKNDVSSYVRKQCVAPFTSNIITITNLGNRQRCFNSIGDFFNGLYESQCDNVNVWDMPVSTGIRYAVLAFFILTVLYRIVVLGVAWFRTTRTTFLSQVPFLGCFFHPQEDLRHVKFFDMLWFNIQAIPQLVFLGVLADAKISHMTAKCSGSYYFLYLSTDGASHRGISAPWVSICLAITLLSFFFAFSTYIYQSWKPFLQPLIFMMRDLTLLSFALIAAVRDRNKGWTMDVLEDAGPGGWSYYDGSKVPDKIWNRFMNNPPYLFDQRVAVSCGTSGSYAADDMFFFDVQEVFLWILLGVLGLVVLIRLFHVTFCVARQPSHWKSHIPLVAWYYGKLDHFSAPFLFCLGDMAQLILVCIFGSKTVYGLQVGCQFLYKSPFALTNPRSALAVPVLAVSLAFTAFSILAYYTWFMIARIEKKEADQGEKAQQDVPLSSIVSSSAISPISTTPPLTV